MQNFACDLASAAGPPEGSDAEPGEQQGQSSGQVNAVHLGFSGEDGLVLTPPGSATDHPENEEKEASYLEPEGVGGSPDGIRSGRQTHPGRAKDFIASLGVEGMAGNGAQPRADGSA